MDDDVLSLAGRGHTASHTVAARRVLGAVGISVGMQLMPGLPGETMEKALYSLNLCLSLNPDFIRIYPALVIAGTKLAEMYQGGGYRPLALDEAVQLCKIMLHTALATGVDVVRIGLQATAELEAGGTILAGPYHPAFRQLVESALFYDLLLKVTSGLADNAKVTILCAPRRISDVTGQKRRNVRRLLRERGVAVNRVMEDASLSPLEIVVKSVGNELRGDIVKDLCYGAKGASFGR